MKNRKLTTTLALTGATFAVALLAGCSTSAGHQPSQSKPTVTAAPLATTVKQAPAPAKITTVNTVGQVIGAGDQLGSGLTAYSLADGTKIAISQTAALPGNVVADIDTKAKQQVKAPADHTMNSVQDVSASAISFAGNNDFYTGHKTVVIDETPQGPSTMVWGFDGDITPAMKAANAAGFSTSIAAVAAAQNLVGADPSYVIVVGAGS
ncbi:hypothetical protein [Gryllotalpicola protaetiae]|uniref:Uncharacterized protein n=1 Tax=Gryllotalpicola protaetiae TaxID=2419771 RepID=A0A387BQS9_9MICO|nr:hypothetical protein [Gryllotalpicola protaetiae]AYG03439.1 hypothetical protein D7I44_07740 [Gryllotalpicola protaetiae]